MAERKQLTSIIFILAFSPMAFLSLQRAARESIAWTLVLSLAICLFKAYLFYKAWALSEGKNFGLMLKRALGDKLAFSILLLFSIYALIVASLELMAESDFIKKTALSQTPTVLISVAMILVCLYGAFKGEQSLLRLSRVLFPAAILASLLCAFLLLKNMDINLSFFKNELTNAPSIKNALFLSTYPLGDIVILLALTGKVDTRSVNRKNTFLSPLLAVLFIFLNEATSLFVLGESVAPKKEYPGFVGASIISIGDFFTRFEVIIWSVYIVCGLVKIIACLYAAATFLISSSAIKRVKLAYAYLGVATIFLAAFLSSGSAVFLNTAYIIFANLFQIALPLLLIFILRKKKRKFQ